MKKKSTALYPMLIITGVFLAVVLVASMMALDPAQLVSDEPDKAPPSAIKLQEPQKKEEPPEPPPQKNEASLLASLAPDSFSGPQDMGSGVSFGSGGFGPAVGGGGGFGTDASQLVKDKTAINRPPRLTIKGNLEYPSEARSRNISGFVVLKILVSQSGGVESLEVEESEPKGFFDQAAMKSVRDWKFEPAVIKGQIVAAWTTQKIKFELN